MAYNFRNNSELKQANRIIRNGEKNGKGIKGSWPNLRYYHGSYVEGVRKFTKNLS
jgi:hypothetical protein